MKSIWEPASYTILPAKIATQMARNFPLVNHHPGKLKSWHYTSQPLPTNQECWRTPIGPSFLRRVGYEIDMGAG